jgi:hypothetical protein
MIVNVETFECCAMCDYYTNDCIEVIDEVNRDAYVCKRCRDELERGE